VHATGGLPPEDVAAHLAACDVLLQPYPDGVSSRRSSVMAGLALGLPVVTTHGFLTEDIWDKTGAVALVPVAAEALVAATDAILSDPGRQSQMALRAAAAYHQHFALERTVLALRGDVSGRVAGV
jgi:glycosyltransferase involved in cell wall biosynthesis